ncbi:hypothetical protein [Natrarchaeobaculum sulfurireducens]|nr:hypothetical protein [Natrarchaeobaculum sulfurireducens]
MAAVEIEDEFGVLVHTVDDLDDAKATLYLTVLQRQGWVQRCQRREV